MTLSSFQAKPTPRGSSLYYALLGATKAHQEAIAIVCSFVHEMKSIIENTSEPQVAKMKLSWWTQEISRLYGNNPQHPLSIAMLAITKRYQLPEEAFQSIIEAMIIDIENHPFSTQDELINYCKKIGAAQLILSCKILVDGQEVRTEFTQNIGIALQIITIIRNFGKDHQHGKNYLSTTNFVDYANHARHYYQQAMQSITKKEYRSLLSMIIIANIYMTLLNEIEHDNFQVHKQKYSLTPIRKYWIGWRTRYFNYQF